MGLTPILGFTQIWPSWLNVHPLGNHYGLGDHILSMPSTYSPTLLLSTWAEERAFSKQEAVFCFQEEKKKEYYLQDGHQRVDLWPGPWRVDEIRNAEIRVERKEVNKYVIGTPILLQNSFPLHSSDTCLDHYHTRNVSPGTHFKYLSFFHTPFPCMSQGVAASCETEPPKVPRRSRTFGGGFFRLNCLCICYPLMVQGEVWKFHISERGGLCIMCICYA